MCSLSKWSPLTGLTGKVGTFLNGYAVNACFIFSTIGVKIGITNYDANIYRYKKACPSYIKYRRAGF